MATDNEQPFRTSAIEIPEFALVLLVGPSGTGKSTFARKHFSSTEILSSDFFRGMVSDSEHNQKASRDAFEVLHLIAEKRLARGRLTVIDATNLYSDARRPFLTMARKYHVQTVAIALQLPLETCQSQNQQREDRIVDSHIIADQVSLFDKAMARIPEERFDFLYTLRSPEEIAAAEIRRYRLPVNYRHWRGPFDIIGDVHGCFDELLKILTRLGYRIRFLGTENEHPRFSVSHPENRRLLFVGDLIDRGPLNADVLRLVMDIFESGMGLSVLGNHDDKLRRKLEGHDVYVNHGLAQTLEQIEQTGPTFPNQVLKFLQSLPIHALLDQGKLVVVHAGLRREMQGRVSPAIRSFALYGDTTGKIDEFGLPERRDWASQYYGRTLVVYGHTPGVEIKMQNQAINLDTGCAFGGRLSALQYPEMTFLSVPAHRQYWQPKRPLIAIASEDTAPPVEGTDSASLTQ